jgi:hypothetical protein
MRLPGIAAAALLHAAAWAAEPTYLEVIFDASGSMEKETERITSRELKVTIAREELKSFVGRLPRRPDLLVALRVFGTDREQACKETISLHGFEPVDDALLASIDTIAPAPFGKTPIARSLEQALDDFKALPPGPANRSVILITDGVETCEGDVDASVARIFESGITLKVHIVGFDVLDWEDPAQKKLEEAARSTGGTVLSPKTREELHEDLETLAKAETPPAPPPKRSRTWVDTLRDNVIVLVGIAVLLLFMGAVLILRRGA